MAKKLVVIDGKSFLYRGYYAMPNLTLADGTSTGGVYGFVSMALEALRQFEPDYMVVAWDKSKTNIRSRKKIYDAYKANRKPMPDDLREQIPYVREFIDLMGWEFLEYDDYEADDIAGTLGVKAEEVGVETVILSGDKDTLQLASDFVTIAYTKRGLSHLVTYTPEVVEEELGFTPRTFIDFKALAGDSSDNIPGVKGVGLKTATSLLQEYGSLDEIYNHIDDIKPTFAKKLVADKDMAYVSRELAEIKLDVPLDFDAERFSFAITKADELEEFVKTMRFRSLQNTVKKLLPKINEGQTDLFNPTSQQPQKLQAKKVDELTLNFTLPLLIIATGSEFAISQNEQEYQVLTDVELNKLFVQNDMISIWGHDVKNILVSCKNITLDRVRIMHDTKIAAFGINSLERELTLEQASESSTTSEQVPQLYALKKKQSLGLDALPKVKKLLQEIEYPFIKVLVDIERIGMKINKQYLQQLSHDFELLINDIKQTVYGLANKEFNISSPQQLSEVLFSDLELPTLGIKKTKTAYSTAASELTKLKGQHEIIDFISKYREYTKLKSTYVEPLRELADENDRLHTTFSLTTAQTGRLSSHNPNLQNIPTRTTVGKKIKKAFIAPAGKLLVQADYSQFELRLAAVLAGDKRQIKLFDSDVDIHAQTAADVYQIAREDVTSDMRRHAKVINFGVLYGMSPHGLAVATGMDRMQAKSFIDDYFAQRPAIRDYLDGLEKKAHDDGYVETLFGRRRPTPDMKSSNFMVRESARRAALNMPIQGTEADLMKMAMNKLADELPPSAEQIMQVHDSIIVECPESEASSIGKQMKQTMEQIYDIGIKLRVDIAIGPNWADLEDK